MGNDGGTIAKRQDIISLHKELQGKPGKANGIVDQQGPVCFISSLPLKDEPAVVIDYLGRLYIKEKLIQYILDHKGNKESKQEDLPKLLNEFQDVHLHWQDDSIVCPQTSRKDICCLRPCGCVVSYKLLKELKKSELVNEKEETLKSQSLCPNCSESFTFDYDLIRIDDSAEAMDFNKKNQTYLIEVLKLNHNKKPLKKKKRKEKEAKTSTDSVKRTVDISDNNLPPKRTKIV